MNLKDEIYNYLEEVLGEAVELIRLDQSRFSGLPHFLANTYQFFDCRLLGRQLVFAQPIDEESDATPAEFAKQVIRLQKHFEVPVVLLLRRMEFYQRNRLVQMGVPFVAPKRQLFLPQLMIDLRENFPRPVSKAKNRMSAPAQMVILYHLLVKDVSGFSLRELARRTGYSAMTLTKVQDELERCGLCEVEQVGRSKYIRFKFKGKKLWKNALPFFRSPVRSVKPLKKNISTMDVMKAGISALSEYTNINDDSIPVYALKETVFKMALDNGEVVVAPGRDGAVAMVELWTYDPKYIYSADTGVQSNDGELKRDQIVDKLSLCLSLKDDPDERVQGELKAMMESVLW